MKREGWASGQGITGLRLWGQVAAAQGVHGGERASSTGVSWLDSTGQPAG